MDPHEHRDGHSYLEVHKVRQQSELVHIWAKVAGPRLSLPFCSTDYLYLYSYFNFFLVLFPLGVKAPCLLWPAEICLR